MVWAINYPTLILDQSTFGLHLKEFQTKRSKPISLPFLRITVVTNFQQKAQIFNDYFAEQCKINDNGSLLPECISKTNASISQINITTNQIIDIIQKHSTKKSHGCDDISVTMLQLCPTEVAVPLQFIFQKCVLTGAFPDSWKCANVVPIHKKNSRQLKSNYIPISLLPIFGKILEKIIFDQVYSFLSVRLQARRLHHLSTCLDNL